MAAARPVPPVMFIVLDGALALSSTPPQHGLFCGGTVVVSYLWEGPALPV